MRIRPNIPLTEEFCNETDFSRYSALQTLTTSQAMGNQGTTDYPWGLSSQQHIDIRTFNVANAGLPESWTNSTNTTFTTGPKAYLNNWNALASRIDGVTSFISIATSLDLTQLGSNANVILALPNWPATYMNLNQCYLDFSSDHFNTFTSTTFAQSITPLAFGDSALTLPLALFTGDLTEVTGVRIRLSSENPADIVLAALRLVGPSWVPTDVDIDTWNGALRQCIPPNGARGAFPVTSNLRIPPFWYVAPTTGEDDPQPINATIGTVFNTGSMLFSNSLSIFMRGVGGADTSQLALNGQSQAMLTGPQPTLTTSPKLPRQVSELQGLGVGQLSGQEVINLSERQAHIAESWITFDLTWGQGIPSVDITTSITGQGYQWSGAAASAIAQLHANTFYLALMSLQDTTAQLQILSLNQTDYSIMTGAAPLFDTGPIRDTYLFPRRAGRIGWHASFLDGDAQIRSVRPQTLTHAEYRSAALNSNTPVKGARVYVQFAPHEQLWTSWTPLSDTYGNQPTLGLDNGHYDPDHPDSVSTRVSVTTGSPTTPGQGIISNVLTPSDDALSGIVDWGNVQVDLSLWMPPEAAQGATVAVSLLSQDGHSIPLTVPGLIPGRWQAITLYPPTPPGGILSSIQSGRYQLVVNYNGPSATFWVDGVTVVERTTTWAARANPTDPWVDFKDLLSSDDAGVLVNPGPTLQVRGLAHRQDEVILSPPRIVPVYAQLGHAVWSENAGTDPIAFPLGPSWISHTGSAAHEMVFQIGANTWNSATAYVPGTIVGFVGTPSYLWTFYQAVASNTNTDPRSDPGTHWKRVSLQPWEGISNYVWSLGDGTTANGMTVDHIYSAPGSYTVSLTIQDYFGAQATYVGGIAVS